MATLLETFRVLTSFEPPRDSLKNVPWEEFAEFALRNGLASLAAYSLEYRLTGADAPRHVREQLLAVHQGTVNDNVMKLVNFKRSVTELEGRKLLVLSGAALAEALYPHIAFRPVIDIDLLLRPDDVEGFTGFMRHAHFKVSEDPEIKVGRSEVALTDTRTVIFLHTSLFGGPPGRMEQDIFERALPMKVYGPSVFRPDHEDAILAVCVEQAKAGYQVPMLSFVDLLELILGAPSLGNVYSKPPNLNAVKARAKDWDIERAVYASLSILERLYPQTAAACAAAKPELKRTSRALLDKLLVEPVAGLSSTALRGADRMRKWLAR